MLHQRITFEWRIGETEYVSWIAQQPAFTHAQDTRPTVNREQQLVYTILRSLALLVIVVVAAAGLSHTPRQLEWDRAEAGILTTLDRENRAWYNLDRDAFSAIIDPNIEGYWVTEWRGHWRGDPGNRLAYQTELRHMEPLGSGLVRATVATQQPAVDWSQVENLQETRYYRESPQGWVRTVPGVSSDYWGEQRTLAVGDLRFIYYDRDAEAVHYAAPVVAEALAELYRLLDIQAPAGYEEFIIELVPDRVGRWSWTDNHTVMTSPTLRTIPDGLNHGEHLAEVLFNRLNYRVVHQTQEPGGRYLFRWTIMNWGMRRWMNSYLMDHPSPWHEQAAPIFRRESEGMFPLTLQDIVDSEDVGRPTREYVIWRFIAAESIVAYGTETYGEETLAPLIRAFVRSSSWEDLTQTVYGVDLDTFTAGWNEYLAREYGLE